MRKAKSRVERRREIAQPKLGPLDPLEDRYLLAPIPLLGTEFQTPADPAGIFRSDGFVATRLISTQTGRIEVDPTGAFGGDVFVVSRGTAPGGGGIIPVTINPGDVAGNIYRVDPYGANAFGANPVANRQLFATIPNGGVSFGGYENWYDLAFDPTGSFSSVNGGPTLYISTLDSTTTGGINPRNAIYGFLPDGTRTLPATATNPTAVAAFSNLDAFHPGILDSQLGAIAIAPGDAFGRDLYIFDVACDNEVGVSCSAGDGNTIFRVTPITVATDDPNPVNLDAEFGVPLNNHVENILPPLTPPPINNDIDVRAMVFDPNRGIILQGHYGLPAFQLYGGMFVASSDIEPNDTGMTRILQFPSLGFPPIDLVPPVPVQTRMIGDMTFDPVGHFGGGLFFTDYVTRSVFQVIENPVTATVAIIPVIANFNVLTPTQFLPTDPPGVTPSQAYRDAFSISFSADGEMLFVSDRDGVWSFSAQTLANSAAGTALGLTDVRELRSPYTGKGYGAAVIDTGVDGAHLGFRNTVASGYNPAFPSGGNFDTDIHGTAVAGIIHQIAPDSIIVPINTLGFGFTVNDLWESVKYVADHPFVDDPRTPGIDESVDNPLTAHDERVRIVATEMALGIRAPTDGDNSLDSEQDAFITDQSTVLALKSVFQRYRDLGIVPVGAAGNEGQLFNGLSGAIIPAILNEVIEVIASYPWGPQPPLQGPPVSFTTTGNTLTVTSRCVLEAGDEIAFAGKITAFSNRNVTSDFAAPGTCVPSYAPSLYQTTLPTGAQGVATAPLMKQFNGTSSASPMVAASFVFGYDTLEYWSRVATAGGLISPTNSLTTTADDKMAALNTYLTRNMLAAGGVLPLHVAPSTISIGSAADHLAAYANQDGINAILQWTAIPREDENIGATFGDPTGTDDDVEQKRMVNGRFRTYSHIDLANFVSAVEASVALNFFIDNPGELAQLAGAAGDPTMITTLDIDAYFADTSNTVTQRAMARLFGGSDRIARLNRTTFLDLVQDGIQDNGIRADLLSIIQLRGRILPGPTDFVITNRKASADQAYAVDPTAFRNYNDLKYRPDSSLYSPKPTGKFKKMSPDQYTHRGPGRLTTNPVPGQPEWNPHMPDFRIVGYAGDVPGSGGNGSGGSGGSGGPGGGSGGSGGVGSDRTADNFVAFYESSGDLLFQATASGDLVQLNRQPDGTWTETNLTALTGGPKLVSDLVAVDQPGGAHTIFGLSAHGHVGRYEFNGQSWQATDLSAAANLPEIASSLTFVQTAGSVTGLYGLNESGELIEYRYSKARWSARNITRETRGGQRLEPGIVAYSVAGKKATVSVYGVTTSGSMIQYITTGKRWSQIDLSKFGRVPLIVPESLTLLPGNATTGLSILALDRDGTLWRYRGNVRLGWESITDASGGPALTGEIEVQTASGKLIVFGTDQQGRVVQFVGVSGGWSWSLVGSPDPASAGDLSAAEDDRLYAKLIDGALAEFWLDGTWQMRRVVTP